ncbi:MAG: AI-2E family transporter [Sphingobacteriaceae bacterium]|nr:AI-2E family transporter [Sphingobacteriaceae bacterium]
MKEGFPITVKRTIELFGLALIFVIIAIGKDLIMPILMAFFISIMLLPIYRFLIRRKVPELIAIISPILVVFVVLCALIWFFSVQLNFLVADFPLIKNTITQHLHHLSEWISQSTNLSVKSQLKMLDSKSNDILTMSGKIATGTALTLSNLFMFIGLLPIYVYLILYYKDTLLRFVFLWFKPSEHKEVKAAVYEIEDMIKNYLIGLLIQLSYMSVLLGVLLLLFGIKHALLIGVIFAILNLIPYIGAFFGNLIGVLITLSSSTELWPVLTVLAVISFVQFLDNNILMPRIVGSKIKINALFSIIGVFVGGSIAGISGMFLSMPIIAVLKIIFDRSPQFKQWGILLGDERIDENPMR